MAFCKTCGNQIPEDGTFCGVCGAPVAQPAQQPAQPAQQTPPVQPAQQPVQQMPPQYAAPAQPYPVQPAPTDHTAEFDVEDISKNKVIAMASYMLGTLGIIIALLAAPESPYASFHSRQALKLDIVTILLAIVTVVLCWTIIVPILGGICVLILLVVRIICFFQVCGGKAKEAPIISALTFLK